MCEAAEIFRQDRPSKHRRTIQETVSPPATPSTLPVPSLPLPLSIIAPHCSTRCRFVRLVNHRATMSASLTRCLTTAAQSSPGLRRHLKVHLGCPAEHRASRVRGYAVLAKRGEKGPAHALQL